MAKGFQGVREDISELVHHLIDAVRTIAPLLAPAAACRPASDTLTPPPSPLSSSTSNALADASSILSEVLRDLKDLGSSLRTEVSRMLNESSSDAPVGREGVRDKVAKFVHGEGVRDEVVQFVKEVVECPDYWAEFPVPLDDEFDMTWAQREHVADMQVLVPKLEIIMRNFCPVHMSEQNFWRLYFFLLHPKLNRHESQVLSTHVIMESIWIIQQREHNNVFVDKGDTVDKGSTSSSLQTTEHHIEDQGDTVKPHLKDKDFFSRYQPTAEPYLETPGIDISAMPSRMEDSNISNDNEEDGYIIVPQRYTDIAPGMMIQSNSSEWVHLRRGYDSSNGQDKLQDEGSEEENKDWLEVEEVLRHRSHEWWREIEESSFDIV